MAKKNLVEGMSERIQALMAQRQITQTDLARMTGLSTALVSQVVTGSTENPRIATLAAIAVTLEVSLDYLVLGEGDEHARRDAMQEGLNANYEALDHRFRFRLFEESEILAKLHELDAHSY